jgi:peptidoglycan/LPS O-acetylase OafA/YrhL
VGVDVFFVISGFLILGNIWKSVREARFSLIAFFERRALRIIPPYAILIVVSSIAACFILVTPQELTDFRRDFIWSGTFAANILYSDILGYFDNAASRHALLHLWSLAVEEQFYILAPLATLAIVAAAGLVSAKHRFSIAVAAGALVGCASLVACIVVSGDVAPQEAFYLTQFRLWEFLLGGAAHAAIPLARSFLRWVRDAGIVIGLSFILVATVFYSSDTAFPGYFVVLPVLGTLLVIAAGAEQSGFLVRCLTTPPVLFLGLISYEVYLWHWPILVFARFARFGELPIAWVVGCVAVAIVLAAATHLALAGGLSNLRETRGPAKDLLILMALLGVYGSMVATLSFGLDRVTREVRAGIQPLLVPDPQQNRSCDLVNAKSPKEGCKAQLAGKGTGLVIGDSHAGANFAVFAEHARKVGAGLMFASFPGCSPFLTVDRRNDSVPATCRQWHKDVRQMLEDGETRFAFAIVTAQWLFDIDDLMGPSQEEAFKKGLRADLDSLRAAGARRILVIGATPLLRREPGDCIVRADRLGLDRDSQCAVPRSRYAEQTRDINSWIEAVISRDNTVRFLDPMEAFCGEQWCSPVKGNIALFADHDHLSAAGTDLLATAGRDDFEWATSASP